MPDPNKYDNQNDFVSACISQRQDEHPGEDNDQSVAICMDMWRGKGGSMEVIHKTLEHEIVANEFVLSDATPDRYGDVVDSEGWALDNFKKNPIALFNHDSNFIVGRWKNLAVRDGSLRGFLELAPKGISARIDEIRALVEAGILKAVSVGFIPRKKQALSDAQGAELFGPFKYLRQELVETSLVSVPANPNALAVAKSLKVSDDTLKLVFAKKGAKGQVTRGVGPNGKSADTSGTKKGNQMIPISKRIQESEVRVTKLKDDLNTHMSNVDDENPTEESLMITKELTEKIEKQEASLNALRAAEAKLISSTAAANDAAKGGNGGGTTIPVTHARPFAFPAKKVTPMDHLCRSIVVALKHHDEKGQRPLLDVLRTVYGENEQSEMTRQVMATMVSKAASVPADTVTTGWAVELVQTVIGEFIAALMPLSVYPKLAAKGGSFSFGRNGTISLPARSSTPTIAGSFFAQGAPIPVRQGAFTPITLTPKKMGVITTLTREITEHSTPSIEGIVRQAILEDTAVAVDTVLLDNNAATTTRPAGLKNGATVVSPTSGGGIAALIGDLKAITSSLITASKGNLRSPVWIMNPGDALAVQLTQAAAGGDFPFMDEIAAGTLMGYPVITSTTQAADTMFLMDAADFMTASGDTPRFDVSDQAVLHMEDTTPLAIGSTGTPPTVAAPTRSLWQTDTIGIRMIMDINWAMRRSGMVHTITVMTWN